MQTTVPLREGVWDTVGHTPLIRLPKLSSHLGCDILAKAEFLNPGGSIKDRTAKGIIQDAEARGLLRPGSTITEGTAGNTGIGLAMLANARGYQSLMVVPESMAPEKIQFLRTLGAEVRLVPEVPFSNRNHFVKQAQRLASEIPGGFFANQFENPANHAIHYATTGPEIWIQTAGHLTAFVSAAGSGGTLAGVSCFLKDQNPDIRVILADPLGSALYQYVKTGQWESDGDSIVEGIGIGRLTHNFAQARVDDAYQIDDRTMVEMAYFLLHQEGLYLGGSAALNVVAAARYGQKHGGRVVTLLPDGGARYHSRLYNLDWLNEHGLAPRARGLEFLDA